MENQNTERNAWNIFSDGSVIISKSQRKKNLSQINISNKSSLRTNPNHLDFKNVSACTLKTHVWKKLELYRKQISLSKV
jgi:hypothetical protein